MSNYRDEHGAPVDWNPKLRGGPGSTGEALFRTYLLETLLAISADLSKIAEALSPEASASTSAADCFASPREATVDIKTVRPPEFVLCNHEQVIHVGGIVEADASTSEVRGSARGREDK